MTAAELHTYPCHATGWAYINSVDKNTLSALLTVTAPLAKQRRDVGL